MKSKMAATPGPSQTTVNLPNKIDCFELCGWNREEVNSLVSNNIIPDHWYQTPSASFALMECVRQEIDNQSLSYQPAFRRVFSSLGVKVPQNLKSVIRSIGPKVKQANSTNNIMLLCMDVNGLGRNKAMIVGPKLDAVGVSEDWLLTSKDCLSSEVTVTNAMIIELFKWFKTGKLLQRELPSVWRRLFPNLGNMPKTPQYLYLLMEKAYKMDCNLAKTKAKASERLLWQENKFDNPAKWDMDAHEQDERNNTEGNEDSLYAIVESLTEMMISAMELLEEEVQENTKLNDENVSLQCQCEQLESQHERMQTQLNNILHINKELKGKVYELKATNINRKLNRRTQKLEQTEVKHAEEVERNNQLALKVQECEKAMQKLRSEKKIMYAKCQYVNKTATVSAQSEMIREMEQQLKEGKKKIRELEVENEDLHNRLDEIMSEQHIQTFENGKYRDDIRMVCYELLAKGVGSSHVSGIIRLVLEKLGGASVVRLPKPTLIKYMAVEQGLLAKAAARDAMMNSSIPVTLQLDGTSKKHKHYVNMMASTEKGTVALSLHEVFTENSDTLLNEAEQALRELCTISLTSDNEEDILVMLGKIKNTMTDRCVVNKAFISKFQDWRAKFLPSIYKDWKSLSEEVKLELATINDLYCGKHLVLNLQDYASNALEEWEKVEDSSKLGREKHTTWGRKGSATMLAVRSFCKCFGPGADEMDGHPSQFNTLLEKEFHTTNKLQDFRGNRFNIPFENSSAVYYHNIHFNHLYRIMDKHNHLVNCIKWDMDDDIIQSGIRAMGIIEKNISSPLMRLVESDLMIMETDLYYTRLFNKITEWIDDPTQVMDGSALLFEDFPPLKDEVYDALYLPVSDKVEQLTDAAITILLCNMRVCCERQLEDHLPGGKFHQSEQKVREETTSCPKDNLATERLFAILDRKLKMMPSATALFVEGVALYEQNNTAEFLNNMEKNERMQTISSARSKRAQIVKKFQEQARQRSVLRSEALKQQEENQKKKQAKKISDKDAAISKVLADGGVCKSEHDLNQLFEKHKGSTRELLEALKNQIRYIKAVHQMERIDYKLVHFSSKGKEYTVQDLRNNLLSLITSVYQDQPSSSTRKSPEKQPKTEEQTRKERNALKQRYLCKNQNPSPSKKPRTIGPFPSDKLIGHRIRHKLFLKKCHHTYKGIVLRRALDTDLDSDEDTDQVKYVVQYDPPNHEVTFCYALQEDWYDGSLELI